MPSVLIVDDEPEVRSLLSELLSGKGFYTDVAGDGDEALERLRLKPWDAVVLDLLMPRVNGFEVLQHLKSLDPDTLRRVIVLTGASDQTLRYFDPTSIHSLLRKPLDKTELLKAVRNCTRKKRSHSVTASQPAGRAGARI